MHILPLLAVFISLLVAPVLAPAQSGLKAVVDRDTPAPVYGYEIVNVYPHARDAFTQGLVFLDGHLYESTGLHGASSLRKVELETGRVLKRHALGDRFFGEGLAAFGPELIQLTFRSGIGFVYDRETFRQLRTFRYEGEGWGLAYDGRHLIMSNGSDILRFLDPETFDEVRRVKVHDGGRPVVRLNELEFIQGEIYANVWMTERIARISPETGRVLSWIDMEGLLPAADRKPPVDVLNGIAYDVENDRLFVTGKLWPRLFEIRVVP